MVSKKSSYECFFFMEESGRIIHFFVRIYFWYLRFWHQRVQYKLLNFLFSRSSGFERLDVLDLYFSISWSIFAPSSAVKLTLKRISRIMLHSVYTCTMLRLENCIELHFCRGNLESLNFVQYEFNLAPSRAEIYPETSFTDYGTLCVYVCTVLWLKNCNELHCTFLAKSETTWHRCSYACCIVLVDQEFVRLDGSLNECCNTNKHRLRLNEQYLHFDRNSDIPSC